MRGEAEVVATTLFFIGDLCCCCAMRSTAVERFRFSYKLGDQLTHLDVKKTTEVQYQCAGMLLMMQAKHVHVYSFIYYSSTQ